MLAQNTSHRFDYGVTTLRDIRFDVAPHNKTGRPVVKHVILGESGERVRPTDRFWSSIAANYKLGKSPWEYFTPAETFQRIAERYPGHRLRTVIERDDDREEGDLLAVSRTEKPIVHHDDLIDLLGQFGGRNISYHDGRVTSTHTPRVNVNFEVLGDKFQNEFRTSIPIDGYGAPSIYLALLRQVCSNGVVGMAATFRSQIALGKDENVQFSLTRVLDGFNNDEGYAALRARLETAGKSWASVHEALGLHSVLVRQHTNRQVSFDTNYGAGGDEKPRTRIADIIQQNKLYEQGSPILNAFHKLTGDITEFYGLANVNALSVKRQRVLPVRSSVYELLNFATEVATHHATPAGAIALHGWAGELLGDVGGFDMENTKEKVAEFADFHIDSKLAAGLTGSH